MTRPAVTRAAVTQAAVTKPPRAAGRADGEHLLAGITSLIERVLGSVAEVGTALTAVAAAAGRRALC